MGDRTDLLRRILGYGALGLSALALFVFISPAFPIRGPALLASLALAAGGFTALAGKEIRSLAARARAALGDGKPQRPALDPLLPVKVLALAKERAGFLTVSEVAIALKVPIDQAEAALESCASSGAALPDYESERGFSRYKFPEFLPRGADPDLIE